MSRHDIQQDIDYVRTLAEEGRQAPMVGGRIMVFWGTLASLTLIAHWAIVQGLVPVPLSALLWIWVGMSVVGGLATLALGASLNRAPGASAANNRAASAIWSAMGVAMLAVFLGVLTAVMGLGAPLVVWNVLPGAALALYGMAYLSAAFLHRDGLQIFAGVAALMAAAGTLALLQSRDAYLVAALGVTVSTLLPGLIYLAREPKLTV
jgi:hypothetical protein